MTAQRADAHTQTINRNPGAVLRGILLVSARPFPFFAALAVIELFVDPGSGFPPAVRQSYPPAARRCGQCRNFAFNIQNCGRRRRQFIGDMVATTDPSGLTARAYGARRRRRRRPDRSRRIPGNGLWAKRPPSDINIRPQRYGYRPQRSSHTVQAVGNHVTVDRVENNNGIIFHAQRRSRVNPVTLPSALAQLWINFVGIIAATAGRDDIERFSASDQASCSVPVEVSPKVGAACQTGEVEETGRIASIALIPPCVA